MVIKMSTCSQCGEEFTLPKRCNGWLKKSGLCKECFETNEIDESNDLKTFFQM